MRDAVQRVAEIRRARVDHADKAWLNAASREHIREERRAMDMLALALVYAIMVFFGAIFADWMTGELWAAEFLTWLRG